MTVWSRRQWRAMGSPSEILVYAENTEDADALIDEALAETERLEACWSRFRDDSELNELNGSDGRWYPTSPTLWEALDKARSAWRMTDGLFDPTIHHRLLALGYNRPFREILTARAGLMDTTPSKSEARSVPANFGAVMFDDAARSALVPATMGIDLGGIGKGLAADLVTTRLMDRGASSVCLSLGGDIRVRGPGPDADGAWNIDIQHPADNRVLGAFALTEEALVQSTTLLRQWEHNGRMVHHIIDPRTGEPSCTDLIGAVVTGVDAWFAEVVAKTAVILGSTDAMEFLIRCRVDGWLLHENGSVTATAAVRNDLETPI